MHVLYFLCELCVASVSVWTVKTFLGVYLYFILHRELSQTMIEQTLQHLLADCKLCSYQLHFQQLQADVFNLYPLINSTYTAANSRQKSAA